ncbi:Cell division and transport-associated protein TolA (TC 2.C.1.2.1) [Alteromonadaceae bacterium Bs31]|nr:Cell division and transport-associated protein TolA (TC 2.C.1.2.1) [Alteromonadaceae bacterium Bs31]
MKFLSYYFLPISISLLLHAGLVAVLLVNWQTGVQPRKLAPPKYIEAKLVELKPQSKKKASAKKKPKIVDLAAKRRAEEKRKQLAEQKRQTQLKKEKEAEAKKAAEKKKREEALKEKKAREKEQADLRRKQALQQEFEEALLEEEGLLQEELYATEASSYADAIRRRIEQSWSRPPSARNDMRCELTIDMVPNGRVVDVNIKTSSGSLSFDRSALAAVKKVEVFPEIKDMPIDIFERHFRKFSLAFQPEDLRQ